MDNVDLLKIIKSYIPKYIPREVLENGGDSVDNVGNVVEFITTWKNISFDNGMLSVTNDQNLRTILDAYYIIDSKIISEKLNTTTIAHFIIDKHDDFMKIFEMVKYNININMSEFDAYLCDFCHYWRSWENISDDGYYVFCRNGCMMSHDVRYT
jgi:hypothetical protein